MAAEGLISPGLFFDAHLSVVESLPYLQHTYYYHSDWVLSIRYKSAIG
jgi:hypothetical protein